MLGCSLWLRERPYHTRSVPGAWALRQLLAGPAQGHQLLPSVFVCCGVFGRVDVARGDCGGTVDAPVDLTCYCSEPSRSAYHSFCHFRHRPRSHTSATPPHTFPTLSALGHLRPWWHTRACRYPRGALHLVVWSGVIAQNPKNWRPNRDLVCLT